MQNCGIRQQPSNELSGKQGRRNKKKAWRSPRPGQKRQGCKREQLGQKSLKSPIQE
jgi:hypothetical protein